MASRAPSTVLLGLVVLCLGACSTVTSSRDTEPPLQPEIATGFTRKHDVVYPHWAVAAANPWAAQAGVDMLKEGGSAVDAAVAVQMVLGLVEPQSSGVGGGAFLLHSDGQRVQAFDGRETAPAAATEDLFLNAQGQPLVFHEAVVGGRAVGTPGVLRMLALAHQQHGRLPWARLFEPAIALARQGFAISPRLHAQLAADRYLRLDPTARAYFYQADGTPHPVGHRLRNPALAALLQHVATEGVSAFYSGDVAQAMVHKVQQHPSNPGRLSEKDLSSYQAKVREPLCFDHLAKATMYRICGMPPPSSGTLAIGQILGLLQRIPGSDGVWPQAIPPSEWLHHYTEAARLALADRAQHVADPDFVRAPAGDWRSLLDASYLDTRAALIGPVRMHDAPAGQPARVRSPYAASAEQLEYGTSHISIVDGQGHAVAMTSSIEDAFGARQMVEGFLLNNQLTDFSFTPRDAQGRAVANRVEPGKRPRSAMSPVLVFDAHTGELLMSAGSPGGAFIIHFVGKTLHAVLNQGLTPQQAIDAPNFGTLGGPLLLETGRFDAPTQDALRARGHTLRELALPSGVQALVRVPHAGQTVWMGGADPRREGVVFGE